MTGKHVALFAVSTTSGTTRRVAMADLRAVFKGLGFWEVRTLFNSGNVVPVSGKQRADVLVGIEKAFTSRPGLTSPVTLISADGVAMAATKILIGCSYIFFLRATKK